MIHAKATREGLIGHTTSTGYRIDKIVPYVALPAAAAKYQKVRVVSEDGLEVIAIVLDTGPWNVNDNAYVFQDATRPTPEAERKSIADFKKGTDLPVVEESSKAIRPQAETGTDETNRPTNGAGIDLGEAVWSALDLPEDGGSATVYWEFVE